MLTVLKRITAFLLTLFLVISSIPIYAEASGTFKTDLVDGLVTKSDRLTFDLWAKDASGNKIEASQIEVLNNNQTVAINWDDEEKTSYTLHLEVGKNNIQIKSGTNELNYLITREYANDGDVIGHFTFSLDAFTLGLGYIIEPMQVPIIKGRTSAEELDEILHNSGFTYNSTGTINSGFYLSTIYKDNLFDKPVQIPDVLKQKLNGIYNETDYSLSTGLGEFDINFMSGWMYSVNNVFPNVGFSDKYLIDGDVMRVQFTLAYGQDIGGGNAIGSEGDGDFFTKVNKDALTKKLAQIHTIGKPNYLINNIRITAYKNALNLLAKLDASQYEIDAALSQLQSADTNTASDGSVYIEEEDRVESPTPNPDTGNALDKDMKLAANRVISQIQVLPSVTSLTLSDAISVQLARQAYDAISSEAKALITNYSKLISAEQQIAKLQSSNSEIPTPSQTAAQKVIDQISKLPTTITMEHMEAIKQARQAYDDLSNEHKLAVVNYSLLLMAEINLSKLSTNDVISNTKVSQTQMLIASLPSNISYSDKKAVEEARASYNALNAAEKAAIKNYETLLNAEAAIAKLQPESSDAVQTVENLIAGLPAQITEANRATVEKVAAAFYKLSDTEQQLVKNKNILLAAIESLQGNENIIVRNGNATLQHNSSIFDMTVESTVLKQLFNDNTIQTITFKHRSLGSITIQKEDLKKVVKEDLTVELVIISIGQKKELIVSLTSDKEIEIPIKLQLPSSKWSNGYLVANSEKGFSAVPHFSEDGVLTANILSNQPYTYTTEQVTFKDISTLKNAEEIKYLANRYVIQGSNGLFNPNHSITRAEFASMIARAIGAKPTTATTFKDIKGKWYESNVQALTELKIIHGVSSTSFNPNAPLTRQHAATMMARLLRHSGLEQPSHNTLNYQDASEIDSKFAADIVWLQQLNIMSGYNGKFEPNKHLTRAQMAQILKRTLNRAKIM